MDFDRIARLIREIAAAEIVPRFRALAADDIREKKPGDLVTIADIEAERRLRDALTVAMPGTVAFGEESVAADPSRTDLLNDDAPVWIIDPIDGTGNFAKGNPRFTVIVAYAVRGVTEAGWIYDPLRDAMIWAGLGGGAWADGGRLRIDPSRRRERPTGSAYGRAASGVRAAQVLNETGRVEVHNRGCSGLEYMEMARGEADFSLHSRSLSWDHAAGMLTVAEAGGVARFLDGTPYDPRIADRKPLAAASEALWQDVARIVRAPAATEA
jgi:fructose-1,6-bisphosphatase/inositol monophosphatase family enzyme